MSKFSKMKLILALQVSSIFWLMNLISAQKSEPYFGIWLHRSFTLKFWCSGSCPKVGQILIGQLRYNPKSASVLMIKKSLPTLQMVIEYVINPFEEFSSIRIKLK